MNRRQVLASIATTSVIGAGFVSGRQPSQVGSFATADVDEVRVERDGQVVKTISSPSTEDIQRLLIERDEDDQVYTSSDCCVEECLEDCYGCDCCMWGCSCNDGCDECC